MWISSQILFIFIFKYIYLIKKRKATKLYFFFFTKTLSQTQAEQRKIQTYTKKTPKNVYFVLTPVMVSAYIVMSKYTKPQTCLNTPLFPHTHFHNIHEMIYYMNAFCSGCIYITALETVGRLREIINPIILLSASPYQLEGTSGLSDLLPTSLCQHVWTLKSSLSGNKIYSSAFPQDANAVLEMCQKHSPFHFWSADARIVSTSKCTPLVSPGVISHRWNFTF